MAIFSDDVDTVRIVGTILIFIFSIIGAGVPIVIARTWGATRASSSASVDDISKADARRSRREAAKAYQSRQTTLKFIQHMFLAIGAGVIVATAIMHMLPEGTEAVTEGYEGLQGGEAHEEGHEGHAHVRAFAVADTNVTDDHDHDHENETDHDHDHDHENETDHDHDHDHENETDHDHDHDHENETDHDHDHDHDENETDHDHSDDDASAEAESGGHSHGFPYGYLFVLAGLIIMFIVESEMHRALEAYDHHEPAAKGDATKVVIESADEAQYQRELSAARTHSAKAKLLELAVATHSVIIGVAFGALTNSKGSNPLALALMFHQLCEGFAVGAVFERAFRAPPVRPVPKGQEPVEPETETYWSQYGRHIGLVVFVLLFALSVPVGIFIGIGVAEGGTDPDAPGSLFARGALECFAGGVLLYVGCVEFLGGLFGSHQHSHVSTDNDCESDEEQAAVAEGNESDVGAIKGIVVRDEEEEHHGHSHDHHHGHGHAHADQGHFLQTDTLFGRLCTYFLVIVGAATMSVIAKWA